MIDPLKALIIRQRVEAYLQAKEKLAESRVGVSEAVFGVSLGDKFEFEDGVILEISANMHGALVAKLHRSKK